MSDIITILYEATEPEFSSPATRAAQEQCLPYWVAVQKAFSCSFVEQMTVALLAVDSIEHQEAFERGLRLGAQLALELTPRPA